MAKAEKKPVLCPRSSDLQRARDHKTINISSQLQHMSRAFVRETDFDAAGAELPERPLSPHPNYVTANGLKQLQERCDALKAREASLANDADDPLAQQELAQVKRDLRYYAERLERAIPVDPAQQPENEVHFGARVQAEDDGGERHVFTIVGEDEADVAAGSVSWASPLARAMMGARVGDSVTWRRPAGDKMLTITAISRSE
jgi:transcription elongation factor GreB